MKKSFTLAEVLITLGIIGIVAAMTLPSLIGSYKEKRTVTAVKAAYSIFSQAYMFLAQDYPDLSDLVSADKTTKENSEFVFNELAKYLKTVKRCDKSTDCMSDRYKTLDGRDVDRPWDDYTNIVTGVLANGMSFWILNGTSNNIPGGEYSGQIGFDINGKKNPNQLGVDFFWLGVNKNGTIRLSSDRLGNGSYTKCDIENKNIAYNGYGCAEWIIQHENMDYLRRRITVDE